MIMLTEVMMFSCTFINRHEKNERKLQFSDTSDGCYAPTM